MLAGATIVHPGAASGSRRWPADRFAAVAAELAADGHRVVITGILGEVPVAREVAELAGLPRSTVLAGRLGLTDLAALVAEARLVLSSDTGVAHMAFAYACPSVTLYGPVSPRLWGPPPDARHVVLWHGTGDRPGDAHGAEVDPRLLLITPDEVLDAIQPT